MPLGMRTTTFRHYPASLDSHSGDGCHSLETSWVPDHLVQGVDDLCKTGPAIAVLLPTVQHELVQGSWAVHRRGQPVVLLNGIDDLWWQARIKMTREMCQLVISKDGVSSSQVGTGALSGHHIFPTM